MKICHQTGELLHPQSENPLLQLFRSITLCVSLIVASWSHPALSESQQSFLPTWKLMSDSQKKTFVSGYLHSLEDAAQVTDLAISHIRENPSQAVESLEQIRRLYDTRHVQADVLVALLDDYYSEPDNKDAPLSRAVSSSTQRVK
ncbi:MAG: hypothetical protein KDD64_04380 [Bdellovibrionales bacterium]|nr:hypothetical protein [Bdellovibrionales bacterium]